MLIVDTCSNLVCYDHWTVKEQLSYIKIAAHASKFSSTSNSSRQIKMEKFSFLDSGNCAVADKLKGEKIKGVGTMARKKLTDISNIQPPPKSSPFSVKDHIQKLLAENAAQRKIINDKNQIIALSGNELQKLRFNLERVQLQNMQLAQASTNMLAELNSGKDRLKSLTHELGCRNGLIEALKLDLQAKARIGTSTCQEFEEKFETLKCEKAAASFPTKKIDGKPCKTNKRLQSASQPATLFTCKEDQAKEKTETKRRRQSARFKAEDPKPNEDSFETENTTLLICLPNIDPLCESGLTYSKVIDAYKEVDIPATLLSGKQDQAKEKTEIKRRRQSARFQAKNPKLTEDTFEIEDTAFPMCPSNISSLSENGPRYSNSEIKDEAKIDDDSSSTAVQQSLRFSVGRPQRRAAEKIQSYKEIPLNLKMRRDAS